MLNLSPWNLLFTVLNLLILLFLVKKFLFKPVMNIIAKRQELIDRQFAEADTAQKEAAQLKEQYENRMNAAGKDAKQTLLEAKTRARAEYDKILADADEKAAQILEEARKSADLEHAKAVRDAKADITRLAVEAAGKIVGSADLASADQALYDEFLKRAGEKSETDGD